MFEVITRNSLIMSRSHAEIPKRDHTALRHSAFLHADAVHHGLIARFQAAVDARIVGAWGGSCIHARQQNSHLRRVARTTGNDQRKFVDRFRRNAFLAHCVIEIQRRSVRLHFNSLNARAHFKLHIEASNLVHNESDATLRKCFKSRSRYLQFICARLKIRKRVQAIRPTVAFAVVWRAREVSVNSAPGTVAPEGSVTLPLIPLF